MKKILFIVIVLLLFVPASADKPGRIAALEAKVAELENKTENLESYVNFILSGAFAEMVCQSCDQ